MDIPRSPFPPQVLKGNDWWEVFDTLARSACSCGGELRPLGWRGDLEKLSSTQRCQRCGRILELLLAPLGGDSLRGWIASNEAITLAGRTYRVVGEKRGGMSTVALCRLVDPRGAAVPWLALKHVPLNPDSYDTEALIRETRIATLASAHPNVIAVYDVRKLGPATLRLVLEGIPPGREGATTLRDWIARRIPQDLSLNFLLQVASAMSELQEEIPGLVHGDLKPENILVGPAFLAKIGDFGLSGTAGEPGPQQGRSLGTAEYLAPECWHGTPSSEASDVYAFGVIALELLTPSNPFAGPDRAATRTAHIDLRPRVAVSLPGNAAAIIEESLSKDPSARPRFADIADALQAAGVRRRVPRVAPDAGYWNVRGNILQSLDDYGGALEAYRRALQLAPVDSRKAILLNVALCAVKAGALEDARTLLHAFRGRFGQPPEYHWIESIYLLKRSRGQDVAASMASLKRALRTEPTNPAFNNLLADLCAIKEDWVGVLKAAQAVLDLEDRNVDAMLFKTLALDRLNRTDDARATASRVLEIEPANAEAARYAETGEIDRPAWYHDGLH